MSILTDVALYKSYGGNLGGPIDISAEGEIADFSRIFDPLVYVEQDTYEYRCVYIKNKSLVTRFTNCYLILDRVNYVYVEFAIGLTEIPPANSEMLLDNSTVEPSNVDWVTIPQLPPPQGENEIIQSDVPFDLEPGSFKGVWLRKLVEAEPLFKSGYLYNLIFRIAGVEHSV